MRLSAFIASLFITTTIFAADSRAPSPQPSPQPSPLGEGAGRNAFASRCAKCHGDNGAGTVMLGRRLGKEKALIESRTDLAPEFIRHVVRNGIVSMPAITRVEVTDDELKAITEYLTRSRR